jgi:HD-GYP domain-containing protein (c-di-GMP phosphodiesterase class II)
MTSDRAYRKAPGIEAARSEVQRMSGKQFDPQMVELFLKIPPARWTQLRAEAESNSKRVN